MPSMPLSFAGSNVHLARFGVLACLGNAGGISMPWLVGVVADASNLRWGLAIAAFTPLLMLVPSAFSTFQLALTLRAVGFHVFIT
jgi:hypothetical protein